MSGGGKYAVINSKENEEYDNSQTDRHGRISNADHTADVEMLEYRTNTSTDFIQPNSADSFVNLHGKYVRFIVIFVVILSISSVFFVLVNYSFNDQYKIINDCIGDCQSINTSTLIDVIAFGSCTAYDLRLRTIFTDAVIPSNPKAWIWTGDMVYLDVSDVNCWKYQNTEYWQQSCNCTGNWLTSSPGNCRSGNVEYANQKWLNALSDSHYLKFLDYMCPSSFEKGIFPPPGTDPSICHHPILGIYDDHDFGWNNGNTRQYDKREFKNMFLDAIGESPISPRRGTNRGAWFKYVLNADQPGYVIDVYVLDERYERSMIPCDTRRDYCERIVLTGSPSTHRDYAWCKDFLHGGPLGNGTCCHKDEDIFYGWCLESSNKDGQYFREACDPTFENFGIRSLVIDPVTGDLREPNGHEPYDQYKESTFCDVLGYNQRRWLRQSVRQSNATVSIFISSSVLLNNPSYHSHCGIFMDPMDQVHNVTCRCGGDDLDCYRVAQLELLHIISSAKGIPIVITGDFHYSDIKALHPGDQIYANYYRSYNNSQTIYQIMASGMSSSTALPLTCADYRLDPMKLRTHPECSFVTGSNFGKLVIENNQEINSKNNVIKLQIMNGNIPNDLLLENVIQILKK